MPAIITDPSAPPADGLDNSQRLLVKRARAIGVKIGSQTIPVTMASAMGGMSATEVAHMYAGAIAGLCGAAMQQLPPGPIADILEATAMAIRQNPGAIRGTVQ